MSLDKRSTAILMQLINADSYLSAEELTEKLNVSRRTIYYDIEKINDWLVSLGIDRIENIRSAGFILTDRAKKLVPSKIEKMKAWHYEYSQDERKAWIALYILMGMKSYFLEDLMEKSRVSRTTTIEDIKSLKADIRSFHLHLGFERKKGYIIAGDEAEIRRAIGYYLSIAIPIQNHHSLVAAIQLQVNDPNSSEQFLHLLKQVYHFLFQSEEELNIKFTDDMLYSLSLRLVLFSMRIAQKKYIKMDLVEKDVLRKTKAFLVTKQICRKLERISDTSFPEDEKFYFTTYLLGARVNYSEEDRIDNKLSEELTIVAKKMTHQFQILACTLFDDQEMLVKNLVLHLKPAFYRVKYGLDVEKNIVDSVKSKFEEVYLLTQKVIEPFEKLIGKPLPENEIAYISFHFGGCLRRAGTTLVSRKKALIVCANGIGTSQILKQQLEGLFSTIDIIDSVSVRDYEEKDYDIDLVFSTTAIQKNDIPIFVVNPILSDAEKEGLLKKVNAIFNSSQKQNLATDRIVDVIERYATIHRKDELIKELRQHLNRPEISLTATYKPNLIDILKEEHIHAMPSVPDWKSAIKLAANSLIEGEYITKEYRDAMISNVEKHGPYIVISPKVAIPHAKPEDGVKKLGISLLKLEEAVSFSNDSKHDVFLIITLAPFDQESHLRALSQLTGLFSKKETVNRLIKLHSAREIHQYIKQSLIEQH
ncbi:transcriptional antiterminator [Robertmurraya siralis]|uniref:Transcriptional antiterminator n=1 Tax=Robertmurraya siralis TaxID=77777 RepID=A0A920BVR8_9BACI|nr:BglG family transcription antiterminator [Robertmurraya siralis]GIN64218.1 transcriptional antiterminator [Robertmurraya siralis]